MGRIEDEDAARQAEKAYQARKADQKAREKARERGPCLRVDGQAAHEEVRGRTNDG